MASPTISITQNLDRQFYAAYRPILCQVEDLDGNAAYMTATIERQAGFNSNVYQSTGITLNAYEDNDQPFHYTFNLMGYVRELLNSGGWSRFTQIVRPGVEETGYMFRIRIHANRYSDTADAPLVVDYDDVEYSFSFYALNTTTNIQQRLGNTSGVGNLPFDFPSIDRLILGSNREANYQDMSIKLSQNSPQYIETGTFYNTSLLSLIASKTYTINMSDSRNDAIYQPVGLSKGYWNEFWLSFYIMDSNGSLGWIATTFVTGISQLYKIAAHPVRLNSQIISLGGNPGNSIIDASGNLVASGAIIVPFVRNSFLGTQKYLALPGSYYSGNNYTVDAHLLDFSDVPDNGKCNRNKFVFRTSSGSFDWINLYGTESKETTFSSVVYDRFADIGFGIQGNSLHTRSVLHNDREDVFTITSQPISKEVGLHVEELITSTMVWIEKEHYINHGTNTSMNNGNLVPILINPGSFEIYSTENNMYFVEFSYTYSEKITMQKA